MNIFALFSLLPLLATSFATPIPSAEDSADTLNLAARGPITHTGVRIVSLKTGKCLSPNFVRAPNDGSPVYSGDCSQARTWDIYQDGSIVMHDYPQFALDAGSNPGNGGKLKVWRSYPGLYQQTWTTRSPDRRAITIGLTRGNQCLDEGENGIQTWQCYPNNPQQVFRTETPY